MTDLLTKEQAAEMLSCSQNFIQTLEEDGVLRRVRIGKRFVRYDKKDIESLIERATEIKPTQIKRGVLK